MLQFILLLAAVMVVLFVWHLIRPKIKNLPPMHTSLTNENASTLIFRSFYTIKEFDGFSVKWKVTVSKAGAILIPPGQHILKFDYHNGNVDGKGLIATGTTEAGKKYLLRSKLTKGSIFDTAVLKELADERDKAEFFDKGSTTTLEGVFGNKEVISVLVECKGDDLARYMKFIDDEMS
jgi:hypothetical protein